MQGSFFELGDRARSVRPANRAETAVFSQILIKLVWITHSLRYGLLFAAAFAIAFLAVIRSDPCIRFLVVIPASFVKSHDFYFKYFPTGLTGQVFCSRSSRKDCSSPKQGGGGAPPPLHRSLSLLGATTRQPPHDPIFVE